ncbi:MAG: Co2+/Mg2+ efflux protein ApaG [Myxococcota bacterium]
MNEFASDSLTEGIRVLVRTKFLPEQSDPVRGIRVFAYTILIANEGTQPAKLLNRHWFIKDTWGHVREVRGPGVVGEQPRLEPGDAFEYTSFCPLPTPQGSMHGTYEMVRDSGERFDARVGEFFLFEPGLSQN